MEKTISLPKGDTANNENVCFCKPSADFPEDLAFILLILKMGCQCISQSFKCLQTASLGTRRKHKERAEHGRRAGFWPKE